MNRIKELRTSLNLLQKELGGKIGYSQRNISDWEQGRTEPNIEALFRLSNFFECSLDYLLGRSDELDHVVIIKNIDTSEEELVKLFRKLNSSQQGKMLGFGLGLLENDKTK